MVPTVPTPGTDAAALPHAESSTAWRTMLERLRPDTGLGPCAVSFEPASKWYSYLRALHDMDRDATWAKDRRDREWIDFGTRFGLSPPDRDDMDVAEALRTELPLVTQLLLGSTEVLGQRLSGDDSVARSVIALAWQFADRIRVATAAPVADAEGAGAAVMATVDEFIATVRTRYG